VLIYFPTDKFRGRCKPVISVLCFLLLALQGLTAVSYQQAIDEIAYWNKRFPETAQRVHKWAKSYYEETNLFSAQKKNETNRAYILRLLKAYPEVKEHEFDPLLKDYRKMFEAYGQDVEFTEADIRYRYYDTNYQVAMLEVAYSDYISECFPIKMTQSEADILHDNWDACEKKVYAAYGIKKSPSLYRISVTNKDLNISIEQTVEDFEQVQCYMNYNTITPVKNRTEYFLEQAGSQEMIFSPERDTQEVSPHHLFCAGAASGLMSNRLAGRRGYNRQYREENPAKSNKLKSGRQTDSSGTPGWDLSV
jgi:hypothetical protein